MATITISRETIGSEPINWSSYQPERNQPSAPQKEIKKSMNPTTEFEMILSNREKMNGGAIANDVGANPFKLTVDPALRVRLRQALVDLINDHENTLANYVAEGKLQLDSYKEYIELFARSLRETMDSHDGVAYLIKSAGFDVSMDSINLRPEWRWGSGFNASGS
ncbi:MAG: hypothetical protein ACOY3I_04205 [Verrucomicrobiota bacterium]